MRKRKMYLSVEDIAELFGLSVSFAYRVVERMNADLASKNYYVILGRVPTRYVEDNESYQYLSEQEKGRDRIQERNEYRQLIHDNIEYEILCQSYGTGRVEELVELMLDAICSTKTYQQINGEAVPTQVVKSRLLKVGYEHIQYVFFSLDRSTSKVKNIRQYMLTVLYNAPATINQFYDAEVRHDMYWGKDIPDR
ncbi:DUF6017 domain-containing protein [Dorea longicatena]|uniref:DUF6017 domain-containing protein n=1 Tax=Dorea longicatena TaxID=88431 RepID=UPI00321A6743